MSGQSLSLGQTLFGNDRQSSPQRLLHITVTSWVAFALVGQWIFAMYVLLMYGKPVLSGDPASADFSHAITGYVEGDRFGNFTLFAHVIPAAFITMGGILQIIPLIRSRFPKFHRWNGRIFFTFGLIGAITGLYLTWGRGSRLSDLSAIGITINGLLIPLAIGMAWKYARLKRFDVHKRWAIHAFLLVNGVWTFRLYLMGWFMVNQGANGNSRTLDGPMDLFFSFACYALPMLVAELVFWAQKQRQTRNVLMVSCVMAAGALITLIGVVAASMMMWFPRIANVLMAV